MLFEEVARRLINIEEHEYSLPNDEKKYEAARQSRFNKPEIAEAAAKAACPRLVPFTCRLESCAAYVKHRLRFVNGT